MIREKIVKLINVKSIITILLTIVFMGEAIKGTVSNELTHIYTVVISFYFGTQLESRKIESSKTEQS